MASSRKLSIALLLYTTILWISQITYDVTANETTAVQDTIPGIPGSPNSSTTSDLDRPEDFIENDTSSTGESQGFYQRYKQFVAKHNKTFTIVFGVLFVISLVGGIYYCCSIGSKNDGNKYAGILIVFVMIILVIVICKLCSQNGFTFLRSKKAPGVNTTVDSTG